MGPKKYQKANVLDSSYLRLSKQETATCLQLVYKVESQLRLLVDNLSIQLFSHMLDRPSSLAPASVGLRKKDLNCMKEMMQLFGVNDVQMYATSCVLDSFATVFPKLTCLKSVFLKECDCNGYQDDVSSYRCSADIATKHFDDSYLLLLSDDTTIRMAAEDRVGFLSMDRNLKVKLEPMMIFKTEKQTSKFFKLQKQYQAYSKGCLVKRMMGMQEASSSKTYKRK